MINANEIDLGLVLHLDPDELLAHGATYSCADALRVKGDHFFLCVGADEQGGIWLPMYSKPNVGRIEVSHTGRQGHPKWRNGKFHYHPGQVWSASHEAIVHTAISAADCSSAGNRNRLADDQVSVVVAALPECVD